MQEFQLRYQKLYKPFSNDLKDPKISSFLKRVLSEDLNFLYVVAIYSIITSILSIAVPISVQLLINSVSYTALLQPVITLGIILFILLIFCGILYALQFYTAELFQRRFLANMSCKLCLRLINADLKQLEEANSMELVNRFFDVITIQKAVPKFLIKTFAFILQSIIGLILVSFYHPFFLIFSIILSIVLYLVYAVYFRKACIAAFYESRRKYDIVGWFEDIAQNVGLFKSHIGQKYAKYKVDELTNRYIIDRKSHFQSLFSQTLLLLFIYAISSTLLLILGGYLVLKEELTIGQLVAAELILSAVLYGMSQFGRDFENMYDIIAACEKLSIFLNIPTQEPRKNKPIIDDFNKIEFVGASSYNQHNVSVDLNLERHKKYMIHDRDQQTQKFIVDAIQDFIRPDIGEVRIDGKDLYSYDMIHFRNNVFMVDYRPLLEGTLIENLTFNRQSIERGTINQVLKDLKLDEIIHQHQDGLDLRIIPSGWPLNEQESVLLKLARAILMEAKIIIINEILDIFSHKKRQEILRYVIKNTDAMIIYFSNHDDDEIEMFDKVLDV